MKEKVCSGCGRKGPLWKAKPPLCKLCASKGNTTLQRKHSPNTLKRTQIGPRKNKIAKKTVKAVEWGKNRVKYYLEAITANILKNHGKCLCDNCGAPIRQIKGRPGKNVKHLIAGNISRVLYLDPRNHFFLGDGEQWGECDCGAKFDDQGKKVEMKIYPEFIERHNALTLEYHMEGKGSKWSP